MNERYERRPEPGSPEEQKQAIDTFESSTFVSLQDLYTALDDLMQSGVTTIEGTGGKQSIQSIKRGVEQASMRVDAAFREGQPVDLEEFCRTVTRTLGVREKARDLLEDRLIVYQRNLDRIQEEMGSLTATESIGGNAEHYRDAKGNVYSCAVTNYYVNNRTGEILAFGNPQNLPEYKENKDARVAAYRVVIGERGLPVPDETIVEAFTQDVTKETARTLQNTAFAWNKKLASPASKRQAA